MEERIYANCSNISQRRIRGDQLLAFEVVPQ